MDEVQQTTKLVFIASDIVDGKEDEEEQLKILSKEDGEMLTALVRMLRRPK